MNPALPTDSIELIDYILSEFHEGHRRDLPQLVRLARQLSTDGATTPFADALQALLVDLEAHMFKEEMRLFPMMEQGGSTLITLLIDDMMQEHARHSVDTAEMTAYLAQMTVPPEQQATLAKLTQGWQAFLAELAKHVYAEDQTLFLMFKAPATAV